jgi:hypothetical protein
MQTQTALARIATIQGMLANLNKELDGLKLELGATPPKKLPVDQAILAVLDTGPHTFNQLYEALPEYPWNSIYQEVKGKNGLEKRNLAFHDKSTVPGKVHRVNDGAAIPRYVREIIARDPNSDPLDLLVQDAGAALEAYASKVIAPANGGKRLFPAHLMKAIKNRGLKGMICYVVSSPTEGFNNCIKAGIPEATMETVVLKHPDRFHEKIVEMVKVRMAPHMA